MNGIDITKLKTSWTKYDIVQVMEVIHDRLTLEKYLSKEAKIDEPILRSFLGVKSLNDEIPSFWYEILEYPKEKNLFAFFALIFTHGEIIKKFTNEYSSGNMKGTFVYEKGKLYTNLRSAIIESGAAELYLRKAQHVPYDFSPIYNNPEVGVLFKQLLKNRLLKISRTEYTDTEFYATCFDNDFHKAISANKELFKSWCEGREYKPRKSSYVQQISIKDFYSIKSIDINLPPHTKEIYLLGENGDGKSLILMAIYLAFNRNYILHNTDKEETGKVADILNETRNSILLGIDSNGRQYTNKVGPYIENLFAYGTYRGRFSTDNAEKYGFMSLFDNNETLTNPISWLKDLRLNELSSEKTAPQYSSPLAINYLQEIFHDILEKNVIIKFQKDEVIFTEKGKELNFEKLSEGYRSVIIFIADLLMRLHTNQPKASDIADFHGVVMVDEIDLHLHPRWQRSLVKKLRQLLPNVQFIFTTHSPNVIQGAQEDAVIYRVYRNTDDGFTRTSELYLRKELDHLMINTLLTSPLFGLSDSRLNANEEFSDTSENYLIYRIHKKLETALDKQKAEGKKFASDEQIDKLIQNILDEELGKND